MKDGIIVVLAVFLVILLSTVTSAQDIDASTKGKIQECKKYGLSIKEKDDIINIIKEKDSTLYTTADYTKWHKTIYATTAKLNNSQSLFLFVHSEEGINSPMWLIEKSNGQYNILIDIRKGSDFSISSSSTNNYHDVQCSSDPIPSRSIKVETYKYNGKAYIITDCFVSKKDDPKKYKCDDY